MTILLQMQHITKSFPGVRALDDVSFSVKTGEIHAICGENGAGKSTLMKVLSGVYPVGSFDGEIIFDGQNVRFHKISDSEELGIIIIHQELALVPQLSISENIFLGNEVAKNGVVDWASTFTKTEALLKKVGLKNSPGTLVGNLGVGTQQLVEIAKALAKDVKLLILDEPTAALQENDSRKLLDLILELKTQGVTSIIISHKLNEIRSIADTITVIRDGKTVTTRSTKDENVTEDVIVRDMVGRDLSSLFPTRVPNIGGVHFEVNNWNVWHHEHKDRQVIYDASLHVRAGEIVGIAGLMGSGRTEFAMSVFGKSYGQNISGNVKIGGRIVDISQVKKAINEGIAYVTEDRKLLGLHLDQPLTFNTTLAHLEGVSIRQVINNHSETEVTERYIKAFGTRTPSAFQLAGHLSGGNQQKVVLSKWLFTNPDVLILDEPTRGIDVGAKFEIYTIINELADQGKAVLMISSELPELLGVCDRIYVMNEGKIKGELPSSEATQEKIMALCISDEEHAIGAK